MSSSPLFSIVLTHIEFWLNKIQFPGSRKFKCEARWATSDALPDWVWVVLLGLTALYFQIVMLIGYNQYYLLNEQLLLKSEEKINPYISVHTTNDSLEGSYEKFGYRCKKSRLEFHNRVTNIYILSAPSLLYLLVVLLLNISQPSMRFPHSYFLEMLIVSKLICLLLIAPALLYLCARTTSLVRIGLKS